VVVLAADPFCVRYPRAGNGPYYRRCSRDRHQPGRPARTLPTLSALLFDANRAECSLRWGNEIRSPCEAASTSEKIQRGPVFGCPAIARCKLAFSTKLLILQRYLSMVAMIITAIFFGNMGLSRYYSPMSFAAIGAPTMTDRFGAIKVIRLSTYE